MRQLTQQSGLGLGDVGCIKIGDGGGFEILTNGLFHQHAHVTTLPCGQRSELVLDAAR